jgi:hypothetical protein
MMVAILRRSSYVFAPLLASAAVSLLTGCQPAAPQRCVDENNHVVDPKFCAALPNGAQTPIPGNPANLGGYYNNGIFFPHFYRFYYGGSGAGFGSIVSGGSYAPLAGHSYSIGGTSRGGFGSSFSGSGGGEGE